MKQVYISGVCHGEEPSTVSVRGDRDAGRGLEKDMAVFVDGRRHRLREEMDVVLVVAEVLMLPEEGARLCVVPLTRHDEEVDPGVGRLDDAQEILDQSLENEHIFCDADVKIRIITSPTS